jgi:hypothetical protein
MAALHAPADNSEHLLLQPPGVKQGASKGTKQNTGSSGRTGTPVSDMVRVPCDGQSRLGRP